MTEGADHLLQVQRSALRALTGHPQLYIPTFRANVDLLATAAHNLDRALSKGADLPAPWDVGRHWRYRRTRGLTFVTRRPNPQRMSVEQWYVTCRLCPYDDHRYTVGVTMESAVNRALRHLESTHGIGNGR